MEETPTITILRHAAGLHNSRSADPNLVDPDLSEMGVSQTSIFDNERTVRGDPDPKIIIVSPMTRTIETAIRSFNITAQSTTLIKIWPDLREAGAALCNVGLTRSAILAKYSHLNIDVSEVHEEWDYPLGDFRFLRHADAQIRAERVRRNLQTLSAKYQNIFVVSHQGFIAYLVNDERFTTLGMREYEFAPEGARVVRFSYHRFYSKKQTISRPY